MSGCSACREEFHDLDASSVCFLTATILVLCLWGRFRVEVNRWAWMARENQLHRHFPGVFLEISWVVSLMNLSWVMRICWFCGLKKEVPGRRGLFCEWGIIFIDERWRVHSSCKRFMSILSWELITKIILYKWVALRHNQRVDSIPPHPPILPY